LIFTRSALEKIVGRLVEITSACGAEGAGLVGKYLRVSQKGNIVLGAPVLLGKGFLERLGAGSEEEVMAFLEYLGGRSLEKLCTWAKEVDQGLFRHVQELTLDDFNVGGKVSENYRAEMVGKFLEWHREYSERLRQAVLGVFGEITEFVPSRLVSRMECRPSPETVSLICDDRVRKLVTVYRARCECGAAAIITPERVGDPSPGTEDIAVLTAMAREHLRTAPFLSGIVRMKEAAEEIASAYFLTAGAAESLRALSQLAGALQKQEIRYEASGWRVGSLRVLSLSSGVLEPLAGKYLSEVGQGRLVPKGEAGEKVRQVWEARLRPVTQGYKELYRALPLTSRLKPSVVAVYDKLDAFATAWSTASLSVSPGGALMLNGKILDLADGNTADVAEAVSLYANFKQEAEKEKLRSPRYNQYAVYKILQLVQSYPARMGVSGISAVLGASKAKKITENKLDRLPLYGALKDLTQQDIADTTSRLVEDGLLSVSYMGRHSLPVLRLPPRVAVLFGTLAGQPEPEAPSPEEKALPKPAGVEEAIGRHSWQTLAELSAAGDWSAEVALNVAAALWPTGNAARIVRSREKVK